MNLIEAQNTINRELANKDVFTTLVETTFKGLSPTTAKKAMMEGMIRGFRFDDFLEKNVYAIPFKDSYSLVTSIDYARKIGMRSGIVGKSAPVYQKEDDDFSCTVTVKRSTGGVVGDYSATVYFKEYNTGRGLWVTKPKTMLAKVAEMHALRMACPEELSRSYIEEEKQQEIDLPTPPIDLKPFIERFNSTNNMQELGMAWSSLPIEVKHNQQLVVLKDQLKEKYGKEKIETK